MCRSLKKRQSWKSATYPCLSQRKTQGRKQLFLLAGRWKCWSKWDTDKGTKATTHSGCWVKQANDEPTLRNLLAKLECWNGRGYSKKLSRKLRRKLQPSDVDLCTKEVWKHQQINAFWMVIIILLRSSMAQDHLCHLQFTKILGFSQPMFSFHSF